MQKQGLSRGNELWEPWVCQPTGKEETQLQNGDENINEGHRDKESDVLAGEEPRRQGPTALQTLVTLEIRN